MSVLHTILLIFALMWSWCSFNTGKSISDIEHSEIQFQVKEFITNYIKENKPQTAAVNFKSLYSRPLDNGDVDVVFSYTIREKEDSKNAVNLSLSGKITLKKTISSNIENTTEWGMESLTLENENIEFTEPLLITPENNDQDN